MMTTICTILAEIVFAVGFVAGRRDGRREGGGATAMNEEVSTSIQLPQYKFHFAWVVELLVGWARSMT